MCTRAIGKSISVDYTDTSESETSSEKLVVIDAVPVRGPWRRCHGGPNPSAPCRKAIFQETRYQKIHGKLCWRFLSYSVERGFPIILYGFSCVRFWHIVRSAGAAQGRERPERRAAGDRGAAAEGQAGGLLSFSSSSKQAAGY